MSDRTVPFDDNEVCDICGRKGAYDFMGDLLCSDCVNKVMGEPEPCNRCGYMTCVCGG